MATRRNRHAVGSGRMHLVQASVEAIPHADRSFDKVLTVHTACFWRELALPLLEITRVLEPAAASRSHIGPTKVLRPSSTRPSTGSTPSPR